MIERMVGEMNVTTCEAIEELKQELQRRDLRPSERRALKSYLRFCEVLLAKLDELPMRVVAGTEARH
jgi:hypothetical protein